MLKIASKLEILLCVLGCLASPWPQVRNIYGENKQEIYKEGVPFLHVYRICPYFLHLIEISLLTDISNIQKGLLE